MEGKTLKERYRLTNRLGTGRLGETYLAEDLQLGREVAVKVILPELAANPAYIQRLEAESRVASGLADPNIVPPLDWGSEEGVYFVVTAYVKGRSLVQVLASEGRIPPDRAARIAADVCGALKAAHGSGIYHCGISSSNIFMDDIGQVRLMDLGMAWDATGRGTPQYVSPEQARGLAMDARSDIYSLGIVFYQMLTGKPPFDGTDYNAILDQHVSQAPTDPSVVNPAIPAALSAIVTKALAKDPALRFASAGQMRDSLLQFLEGAAAPASPAPVAAAVAGMEEGKGSSAGAWALGIVLGLIVAGAIVVLLLGFAVGPKWFVEEGDVTVPNVVGLSEDQARSSLDGADLKMDGQDDFITSESQKVGVISSQSPSAGTTVAIDSKVSVKVTRELRMPNVTGQSQSDAENTLKKQGISVIVVNKTPVTDPAQIGKVVKQDPAGGALISPGISVTLTVGVEATTVAVPDVTGKSQADATSALNKAGFNVTAQAQKSATVPAGQVISQNPSAGTQADKGSAVTIMVSSGP